MAAHVQGGPLDPTRESIIVTPGSRG